MENVDNLAEPAGRLSQSTTLRGCYVPALVKGSMAWLLSLPVGQALPLASSYRSTLFSFGEGPTVRIRFPPAGIQLRTVKETSGSARGRTSAPVFGNFTNSDWSLHYTSKQNWREDHRLVRRQRQPVVDRQQAAEALRQEKAMPDPHACNLTILGRERPVSARLARVPRGSPN